MESEPWRVNPGERTLESEPWRAQLHSLGEKPHTQNWRRPGSPHSKKLAPPSPEGPSKSILNSSESTLLHHFGKKQSQLSPCTSASSVLGHRASPNKAGLIPCGLFSLRSLFSQAIRPWARSAPARTASPEARPPATASRRTDPPAKDSPASATPPRSP